MVLLPEEEATLPRVVLLYPGRRLPCPEWSFLLEERLPCPEVTLLLHAVTVGRSGLYPGWCREGTVHQDSPGPVVHPGYTIPSSRTSVPHILLLMVVDEEKRQPCQKTRSFFVPWVGVSGPGCPEL